MGLKNKLAIVLVVSMLLSMFSIFNVSSVNAQVDEPTLDPSDIPKFVNQLVIPPVYIPSYTYDYKNHQWIQNYRVDMTEFTEQILPTMDENGIPTGFAQTTVWGYGGIAKDAVTGKYLGYFRNSPGATFEITKGLPSQVTWINKITTPEMFAVDPTLHWANPNNIPMMTAIEQAGLGLAPPYPPGYDGNPIYVDEQTTLNPDGWDAQSPVPLVTHVHGAIVRSDSDGGPEQWFTATGVHGQDYATTKPTSANSAVYYYPNDQQPATIWYHDHALGVTRLNVMSGLAGFYLIRDPCDTIAKKLPTGQYEIPIAIQDRSFNTDGSMWFPSEGNSPTDHPYWNPEFFGNTIMVNGKVWPNLDVDRGQYRFRVLDGSNARFYNMQLKVDGTGEIVPFTQIGTDGGYLQSAVQLTSLLIAPGERVDILVDFSKLAPGTKVIMTNDANAPYPDGDPVEIGNTDQIMQFTVGNKLGFKARNLPPLLEPTLKGSFPTLVADSPSRTLPYFEEMNNGEPVGVFLNGQKWMGVITETPKVGSTEDWWLVNPTGDTHPIHTHLAQFQVVYRQAFDAVQYEADWMALNGPVPVANDVVPQTLSVQSYLTGQPEYPPANEKGWKDTIQTPPGYVTVIRIRWAPQDTPVTGPHAAKPGVNLYSFDPSYGPGYVWHCHILDHEDNEMMRPYQVMGATQPNHPPYFPWKYNNWGKC
jgi:FtsP/CotA-like multicopper oxidase with cupredoxin domain